MKFARQFLIVTFVVALIVGLGVAWGHTPARSLVADQNEHRDGPRGDERRPPGDAAQSIPSSRIEGGEGGGEGRFDGRDGRRDRRRNSGLSLSNIDELAETFITGGIIVGGVVAIDIARRKRRRVATHVTS